VHLGIPEIILILIVILLLVGPKKLPGAGEALGKAMRSFRRAFSGESDKKAGEGPGAEKSGGEQTPGDDSGSGEA
jgi:sec-independent protein translocase protein TatA